METLLNNIWAVYLDTAFWLLLGLLAAGFVKAYIPEQAMQRWLGGRGLGAIGRAALFGAPLPLCSCGVLPAAISLRRGGASREATVAFLIATPETSIDSVTVTYALMGPVMAIYRPLAALMSAVVAGLLTVLVNHDPPPQTSAVATDGCASTSSCCSKPVAPAACCSSQETPGPSCCGSATEARGAPVKWRSALRFAGAELLDDISRWLFLGIAVAGVMTSLIPEGWLAQWGQGLPAMLVMLLVGIPMYICAVASTPIAAGLVLAGVSPGTVLVFLLVGPATNIAGLVLVKKELGLQVTLVYVLGISLVSMGMGLFLDYAIGHFNWQVVVEMGLAHRMLPDSLSYGSALLLLLLVIPALRNRLFPFFR